MVGWHYQLNGCEFEQAPGDGEGQGSLECCSPWGHKELDTTEQLNNNLVPKMNIHGTDLSPVHILELRQSASVKPKSTPDMQAKTKKKKPSATKFRDGQLYSIMVAIADQYARLDDYPVGHIIWQENLASGNKRLRFGEIKEA